MKYITPQIEIIQLQTADVITFGSSEYEGENNLDTPEEEW